MTLRDKYQIAFRSKNSTSLFMDLKTFLNICTSKTLFPYLSKKCELFSLSNRPKKSLSLRRNSNNTLNSLPTQTFNYSIKVSLKPLLLIEISTLTSTWLIKCPSGLNLKPLWILCKIITFRTGPFNLQFKRLLTKWQTFKKT